MKTGIQNKLYLWNGYVMREFIDWDLYRRVVESKAQMSKASGTFRLQ